MSKKKQRSVQSSTCDTLTHAEAFALLEREIAAVPDHLLVVINTDIPFAVETAFTAAGRVETLMPQLENAKADDFDLSCVRKLRLYAGATLYAHLMTMAPVVPNPELPAMLEEAIALRGDLLALADVLGRLGLLSAKHVAAIRSGQSHRDTANGLTALAALYIAAWDRIGHRVPIERSVVDRAAVLGTKLLEALGDRRLDAVPIGAPADARRTRARAYALFVEAYDTCQRGVWFLRWRHDDVEKYVPSLYPHKRPRSASVEAEESTAVPQPEPIPTLALVADTSISR